MDTPDFDSLRAACDEKDWSFWARPDAFHSVETFEVAGWKVAVFFDGNDDDWDYIDYVVTPDGRKIDYDALPDDVRFWSPKART